ncbi:MAG: methyl-accepting chemotaxis protein, partial [Myxococcota bacterium]
MKNARLAVKIGAGFALVLALMAVVALVGYRATNSLAQRARNLAALDDIVLHQGDAIEQQRAYRLTKNEATAEEVRASSAAVQTAAEELKGRLRATADQQRMDELVNTSAAYRTAFEDYVGAAASQGAAVDGCVEAGNSLTTEMDDAIASFQGMYESEVKRGAGPEALHAASDRVAKSHALSEKLFALRAQAERYYGTESAKDLKAALEAADAAAKAAEGVEANAATDQNKKKIRTVLAAIGTYRNQVHAFDKARAQSDAAEAAMVTAAQRVRDVSDAARDAQLEVMRQEESDAVLMTVSATVAALLLGLLAAVVLSRGIVTGVRRGVEFAT